MVETLLTDDNRASARLRRHSTGLYQFNVVVPSDAPSGDVALQLKLSGDPAPQTLYITVQQTWSGGGPVSRRRSPCPHDNRRKLARGDCDIVKIRS